MPLREPSVLYIVLLIRVTTSVMRSCAITLSSTFLFSTKEPQGSDPNQSHPSQSFHVASILEETTRHERCLFLLIYPRHAKQKASGFMRLKMRNNN